MSKIRGMILFVFVAVAVQAQMPQEVLLLVNKNSQPSLKVANTFAALRQIPKRNVVYLDIPESAYGGSATVTPEQFTDLIWDPANAVAQERGIDSQILAWVYSVDFPIRVKTDASDRKQMSVGGLTFMRNKIPGLSLVEEGKYLSKLFAGPNQRLRLNMRALSLGMYKSGLGMDAEVPGETAYLQGGLGARMPLPSMMLGYIGENGSDVDTVISTLIRGRQSDFRGVRDGIYFVTSDDVRSKCREWQYAPAAAELQQRGINAVVTTNFPAGATNVMGVLVGAEKVDPSRIASFVPGAMAEHLTSWSAEFQRPQTKMTEWLKAGATASAGAVVEPYSIANKFPSARFYVHYASGCSMLESFYQSIACPLQSLLLGDPMAKPYAIPLDAKVLGADRINDNFTYVAQAICRVPDTKFLYSFLLDGQPFRGISDDPSAFVPIRRMSDGYHELRAVVMIDNVVRFSATRDKGFVVNRKGRSVAVLSDMSRLDKNTYGIKVNVEGEEKPNALKLLSGELVLDEKPYASDVVLALNERLLGEGPNRVRVVAVYADGMEVSSEPFGFSITFAK